MHRAARARWQAVAFLTLIAPVLARGHGSEFIFAKLVTGDAGGVCLEMTADYGENPMLPDVDDAQRALRHALRVKSGGAAYRDLDDLAPLQFERRAQFDATAPLPKGSADERPHSLLTAIWRWAPKGGTVTFDIPADSPHGVIFWTVDARSPVEKPLWLYLLKGEETPAIPVPVVSVGNRKWGWIGLGVVGLLAIGLAWRRWGVAKTGRFTTLHGSAGN